MGVKCYAKSDADGCFDYGCAEEGSVQFEEGQEVEYADTPLVAKITECKNRCKDPLLTSLLAIDSTLQNNSTVRVILEFLQRQHRSNNA